MPATVITLGAVLKMPRAEQPHLILAGKEYTLIRDEFKTLSFYHVLEYNDVLRTLGPKAGDVLHVISEASPVPGTPGRVHLRPTSAVNYGPGQTTLDRQKGHVLTQGINLMTCQGQVIERPREVLLDDLTPVVNINVRVNQSAGRLETVSYGVCAVGLSKLSVGDEISLQGRMLNEKRPNGEGSTRLYSRLETWRQSRRDAAPHQVTEKPRLGRATGQDTHAQDILKS